MPPRLLSPPGLPVLICLLLLLSGCSLESRYQRDAQGLIDHWKAADLSYQAYHRGEFQLTTFKEFQESYAETEMARTKSYQALMRDFRGVLLTDVVAGWVFLKDIAAKKKSSAGEVQLAIAELDENVDKARAQLEAAQEALDAER